MLAAVFFSASGGALAEEAEGNPLCNSRSIWEELGKIIAIAMVSACAAVIPGVIISCLHVRDFLTFQSEGCDEWVRQLRIWRLRDIVIWILGVLYIVFCLVYAALFLASVRAQDALKWSVSVMTAFGQSYVGIPALMSTAWVLLMELSGRLGEVQSHVRSFLGNPMEDDVLLKFSPGSASRQRPQWGTSKWNSPWVRRGRGKESPEESPDAVAADLAALGCHGSSGNLCI